MPAQPAQVTYNTAPIEAAKAGRYDREFFPGTRYDPAIVAPEACLGHPVGARLARPEAILGCFEAWAAASPKVRIEPYATSYEGRALVRVVITSEANQARLDELLAAHQKLADPRGVDAQTLAQQAAEGPAVAWFGYSIHGDEVSGADASVGFGYHLIAAVDGDVPDILDQVVVVIDPVMNPDGRARIISMIEQSQSAVPNLNDSSMHRGRWPWGRGNHYLFDMNRDWITGAAPETRGRWQGHLRYNPQLVVDAHEMGSDDTYLFYPYAEPVNPNFASTLVAWQRAFAADHSRAFDRYGWAYYTREWADGWFPGYSDGWASVSGAIGILYEQSSNSGLPLRKPSGREVLYRETVHAQAVSSLSNLRTLAANRAALLSDYVADKQRQLRPNEPASFFLRPGRAPDRERRLIETLLRQGVEVYRADAEVRVRKASSMLGEERDVTLPAGTYMVSTAQPRGALARALLEPDVRMPGDFLATERAELERKGRSKIFDLTAWSLGHAYGLDGYWAATTPRVARTQVTSLAAPESGLSGAEGAVEAYAWVVDGRADASLRFAVEALERGLIVHVADKDFRAAGRSFVRGSVLVRRGDNGADGARLGERLAAAAAAAGVEVVATNTGLSTDDGPDLGGRHFRLLHRPRVAVLSNAPVWPSDFGHIWHQLDRELGLPMTMIDAQHLERYDLRRYDVLVVPPASPKLAAQLAASADGLKAWLRAGGTLIAVGSAAALVADDKLGLSKVRRRHDVLAELPLYRAAVTRELEARAVSVDEDALWTAPAPASADDEGSSSSQKSSAKGGGAGGPQGAKAAAERDAWMRRFSPRGAMLRGLVDEDAWLTFGVGAAELPVLFSGSHALMSRAPVATPVRLADAAALRLAGLVWPEARERLALSAYLTAERVGAGQVILFASPPGYRGATPGTARLFANAVVYGASLGASRPQGW